MTSSSLSFDDFREHVRFSSARFTWTTVRRARCRTRWSSRSASTSHRGESVVPRGTCGSGPSSSRGASARRRSERGGRDHAERVGRD